MTENEKTDLSVTLTLLSYTAFFMERFNICGIQIADVEKTIDDFQTKMNSLRKPPSTRRKRGLDNDSEKTDRDD